MSERKYNQAVQNARRWRIAGLCTQPGDTAFLRQATRNRQRTRQLLVALAALPGEPGLDQAEIIAADDDTAIIHAASPRDAELIRRRTSGLIRSLAPAAPWLRRIEIQVKDGR